VLAAGSIRSVVTILARGPARDAAGQPLAEAWAPFANVRANVRHLSGAAAIKADGEASVVRASMRIRYREDITAGMRAQEGADLYNIDAVLPDKVRREFVDLACTLTK